MLRRIKKCPLIGKLRNGEIINFEYDVIVKGMAKELTVESLVEISVFCLRKGMDVYSVIIDEEKLDYSKMEVI